MKNQDLSISDLYDKKFSIKEISKLLQISYSKVEEELIKLGKIKIINFKL